MNNVQFVTMVLGFIALLLTIMGGAWLNQRALERQMDSFRQGMKAELRAEIAPLRSEMQALSKTVERIDQTLQRLYQPILPGKGD